MRMHEIMATIQEAAGEPELPGRVASLLNTPKPLKLKDGRSATLLVTRTERGLSVTAKVDGDYAGHMDIDPNRVPPPPSDPEEYDMFAENRGSWSVASVTVSPEYQRQGIGTAMYDLLARAGMKILPSGHYGGSLRPDGQSLWYSNRPPINFFSGKRGGLPKPQRFWKPRSRR